MAGQVVQSRRVILFFAAISVLLSGAAAWIHYQLVTTPSYTTPCDINATFNCTEVYLSPYGSVAGVPVAIGGILWGGLMWVLASALGRADQHADANKVLGAYIVALGWIGVAVSAYFAYISFAVLSVKCIFCLGTYACVLAIIAFASRLPRVPLASLPSRLFADLSNAANNSGARLSGGLVLAVTLVLAVVFARLPDISAVDALAAAPVPTADATGSAATPGQTADAGPQQSPAPAQADLSDPSDPFVQYWNSLPIVDTGVPLGEAKVVVVKFQDFMCPTCKVTYEGYKPILDRFAREMPGVVKYVEKDYPLEAECNPGINGNHVYSCEAAAAVRLAHKAGKGQEFEAWVWTNQASLTTPFIIDGLARVAGVVDFAGQYESLIPDIRRDALEGQALQVSGTPMFFIGKRAIRRYNAEQRREVPDVLPPAYFQRAIEMAIAEAGSGGREHDGA